MPTPKYLSAQEGFFVFGLESAGMLPADVDVLPTAPSLSLGGYSSVPAFEENHGTQPIPTVGMRSPADFLHGEREARTRFSTNLGTGAGARDLLLASFTNAPTDRFPLITRHQCLPVICIGGGAMSACNSDRSYTWLARHQLINTTNIQFAYKQPITVNYATEGISIQRGAGVLNTTQVNKTAIKTSGGRALGWHHVFFKVGTYDLTRYLQSAALQNSNNVTRDPAMRGDLTGGDSNPLSRTSVGVSVGDQTCNVNLSLSSQLPAMFVDAAADSTFWENIGPLQIGALKNGVGYMFEMPSSVLASYNQNEVQPRGRFTYSATLMGADLTAAYVPGT